MLRFMLALWNSDYICWTFGSLFFIIVFWLFCFRFSKTSNQNYCQCQRKIKKCLKASEQRVWRFSQEDTKIPLEHLWVLERSQITVPRKSRISHNQKLLYKDPACSTCNSVSLEAKFLLSSKKDLHPPQMLCTSPVSSCLEGSTSSGESLFSPFPVQTPLIMMGSWSPTLVLGLRDYWTGQVQREKKFDITSPLISPTKSSTSRPEKLKNPATNQDITVDGDLFIKPSNQTKDLASKHLTRQSLELHIKKRVHFQRWGLPSRVEESLKQLRPETPLHYCTGKEIGPFFPEEVSKRSITEKRTVVPHNLAPLQADQPGQSLLHSELLPAELGKTDLKRSSEEALKPISTDLTSPSIPVLSNFCPLNGGTNGVKTKCLHQYSQFFWGLPSLHSEYLVASCLRHDSLSSPTSTNKLTPRENTIFFNEQSYLPWLPHSPPSFLPTKMGSNIKSPEATQISFHYIDKTLERHILPEQFQVLWGLPSLMQMPLLSQNPLDYEFGEVDKTILPLWCKMNVSVLTKELLFLPDHARKLLELHFQRRLLQHQVESPEHGQESVPLLQSQTNHLQVPKSTSTKVHKRCHQSENPQHQRAQAPTPKMTIAPVIKPETYAKAKEIAQIHVEKKCLQIKQGIFPDIISDSRDIEIQFSPGDLPIQRTFTAACSNTEPEGLAFQDTNATAEKELGKEQQTRTALGKIIQKSVKTWTLPQHMIEKLETIVRHKYLDFLSGLPSLYHVALCKEMSPDMPGKEKGVKKEQIGHKGFMIWAEEKFIHPKAEINNSTVNSGDTENELQVSQQIKVSKEEPKRGGDTESSERIKEQREFDYPQFPHSPSKSLILTRMDSHLRKKVLEINGLPKKVIDSRKLSQALESPLPEIYSAHILTVVSTENSKDLQETLSSLGKQELPEMSSSPATLDAEVPMWTYFKEQFSDKLELSLMRTSENHTESCPIALPLMSTPVPGLQASKVTQPYSQRKPIQDMADTQVLCVHRESEQRSPGQVDCWNKEPQTPWDCKAKAIGSIPNKREGSKGEDQSMEDVRWRTSSLKWSHALKPRRTTESCPSMTHKIPHPRNRDHYETVPLQELSQSFPKAENSRAIFGVTAGGKSEKDDYQGNQRKLKDSFPQTKDPKHPQSRSPKNSIKQRATSVLVSDRTVHSSQRQPSSGNSFREKIKHFFNWLSLQKKHNNRTSSHTFPWIRMTPSNPQLKVSKTMTKKPQSHA